MCIICGSAEFFTKKTDRKNVATLQTCCREIKSCKKLVFYLKKALSILAHLEPEILLIEVAYF
jgi:hypothetical protein